MTPLIQMLQGIDHRYELIKAYTNTLVDKAYNNQFDMSVDDSEEQALKHYQETMKLALKQLLRTKWKNLNSANESIDNWVSLYLKTLEPLSISRYLINLTRQWQNYRYTIRRQKEDCGLVELDASIVWPTYTANKAKINNLAEDDIQAFKLYYQIEKKTINGEIIHQYTYKVRSPNGEICAGEICAQHPNLDLPSILCTTDERGHTRFKPKSSDPFGAYVFIKPRDEEYYPMRDILSSATNVVYISQTGSFVRLLNEKLHHDKIKTLRAKLNISKTGGDPAETIISLSPEGSSLLAEITGYKRDIHKDLFYEDKEENACISSFFATGVFVALCLTVCCLLEPLEGLSLSLILGAGCAMVAVFMELICLYDAYTKKEISFLELAAHLTIAAGATIGGLLLCHWILLPMLVTLVGALGGAVSIAGAAFFCTIIVASLAALSLHLSRNFLLPLLNKLLHPELMGFPNCPRRYLINAEEKQLLANNNYDTESIEYGLLSAAADDERQNIFAIERINRKLDQEISDIRHYGTLRKNPSAFFAACWRNTEQTSQNNLPPESLASCVS